MRMPEGEARQKRWKIEKRKNRKDVRHEEYERAVGRGRKR